MYGIWAAPPAEGWTVVLLFIDFNSAVVVADALVQKRRDGKMNTHKNVSWMSVSISETNKANKLTVQICWFNMDDPFLKPIKSIIYIFTMWMRIKYFPNVQSENYDQKPFVATIILHVTKYIQNYYHSNSAREHKVRNHLVSHFSKEPTVALRKIVPRQNVRT